MTNKRIIEEYLRNRGLESEGIYKIHAGDFLSFFLTYLEEKGHFKTDKQRKSEILNEMSKEQTNG
jgi:hypothetical protein